VDRFFGRADHGQTRARLIVLFAALAALNALAWVALLAAAHRFPLLLALGVTAYVLGMRHALDADHIAAIDSTTRKLVHSGQRPIGVGLYFSLGHSTIVFALSLIVAGFGVALKGHLPAFSSVGTILGSSISALFLLAIAAANALVLLEILQRGRSTPHDSMCGAGLLTRLLRPALALVTQSRHMYPLGMLFGLGFDTATEIALLGISAASGASGMPVGFILVLPLLFVAGMSLIDTSEGVAVLGAFGWACGRPGRKFMYNVGMTTLSVALSLVVGLSQAAVAIGAVVQH
jgi:nickel/cobalt transporter (NiCoT) family protein